MRRRITINIGSNWPARWSARHRRHEMKSSPTLLFTAFSALSFGTLLAEDSLKPWREYFDTVSKKNIDLAKSGAYDDFICMAREFFPDSYVYKSTSLEQFILRTAEGLQKDDKSLDLAYAKHFCKFFDFSQVKLKVDADEFQLLLNAARSDGLRGQLLEIARNIGLNILAGAPGSSDSIEQARYGTYQDAKVLVRGFGRCDISGQNIQVSLKNIGLLIADGALDGEVDMNNEKLEGHNPWITTCFLAQLITKSLSIEENHKFLDIQKLSFLRDNLHFVSAFFLLTSSLAGYPQCVESLENLTLQLLRDLKIDEFTTVPVGISAHEIAMSVVKRGPRLFDVLVFNSGLGLEYHSSFQKGNQIKYFPAKMYTGITLSELKISGFFRKTFEILATADFKYKSGEQQPISTDNVAFYEIALASLKAYEHVFNEDDSNVFAVIPPQRSGTCAIRAHLAFLAWFYRGFRQMKLILIKDLFHEVAQKQWDSAEEVTLNRLMKFGMENYARSALKFLGKENLDGLPGELLWPKLFDESYEKHSALHVMSKEDVFSVDDDAKVRDVEFLDEIKLYGKQFERDFVVVDKYDEIPSVPQSEICRTAHDGVFRTQSGSLKQMEMMDRLISECWQDLNNDSKLAFLVSTILYKWPEPTYEVDVYDEIFLGNQVDRNERVLFNIVKNMINLTASLKRYYPAYISALVKIKTIFQKGMSRYHTAVKHLSGISRPSSVDQFSFLCPDFAVHKQMDRVFNPNEFNYGKDYLRMGDCPTKSPLLEYIEKLYPEVDWSRSEYYDLGSVESRREALLRSRLTTRNSFTPLPSHHYFWVILHEELERILRLTSIDGECFSLGTFEKEYDPLKEKCTLYKTIYMSGFHYRSDRRPDIFTYKYDAELNVGFGRFPVCLEYQKAILEARQKSFGLTDNELGIFYNIMRVDKHIRLEVFVQLLTEDADVFDWATIVHLGLELIHFERPGDNILETLFDIVMENIRSLSSKIGKNISELQYLDETHPPLLKNIRQFAGFIVLESALDYKLKHDVGSMLRGQILAVLDVEKTNRHYSVFLSLAYILSVMNGEMTIVEAKHIVKLFAVIIRTSNLLQKDIVQDYYLFHAKTIVSNAMWQLELKKHSEPDRLIDLYPGLDINSLSTVNFPWIQTSKIQANILSGALYIDGILSGEITPEYIKTLLKANDFEAPDCIEYEVISKRIILDSFTTFCRFKDGHRPFVLDRKNEKLFMKELTFLTKADKFLMRIRFSNGHYAYVLDKNTVNWDKVPIPVGNQGNYSVLFFVSEQHTLFLNSSEFIWVKEDAIHFGGLGVDDMHPVMSVNINSPLTNGANVKVFETFLGDTVILFSKYGDDMNNPLWFLKNSSGQFCYQNDQQLVIAKNQNFEGCNDFARYLVLENTNHARKVILPVEHIEIASKTPDEKKPDREKLERKKNDGRRKTLLICLSTNNTISPQSRLETILIAYHYLVARRYENAFGLIRRIHHMEPFTPAELQSLAWIVYSNTYNKDGSPDSIAVRSFAAFMVYKNNMLFQFLKISSNNAEKYVDPYEKEEFWVDFWSDEICGENISRTLNEYFHRISKIPVNLQFHTQSNRHFLIRYEERTWLESLLSLQYTQMYLGEKYRPKAPPVTTSPDPQVREFSTNDVSRCRQSLDYDLIKKSSVKSFGFSELEQKDFICWIINSDLDGEKYFAVETYLKGFINTKSEQVAVYLLKFLNERHEFVKLRKPLKKDFPKHLVHELNNKIRDHITNDNDGFKLKLFSESPPQASTYEQSQSLVLPSIKDNDKCPSTLEDISTMNLKDSDLGLGIEVNQIKELLIQSDQSLLSAYSELVKKKTLIDGKLTETLNLSDRSFHCKGVPCIMENLVHVYEETVNNIEAVISSNITGSYNLTSLENRLKIVAHNKFKICRSELLHLFARSRSFFYQQILPGNNLQFYQELHHKITRLALSLSNLHDLRRLRKAYNDKVTKGSIEDLMTELTERKRSSKTTDNIVLAYEIQINSRLTEQQLEIIHKFAKTDNQGNYSDIIYELIMSAGKSFVLSSILALLKANYQYLSVMILPRSLFIKEAPNLMVRTMNAFGGEGFSFRIERSDTKASHKSLEWLRESLVKARRYGQYVIQTPETILTLENKMVEFGITSNQLFGIIKGVMKELRFYGTATVDEVQEVFPPDKELNFPLTSLSDPNQREIIQQQALILCEVLLTLLEPSILALADIRKNIQVLDDQYKEIKDYLALELIKKLENKMLKLPVKLDMDTELFKSPQFRLELKKFFTETSEVLSKETFGFIRQHCFNSETLNILAICRLAITEWVPLAWKENVNEHYGLSDLTIYVVPYANAGNPKKGAEYSFRWFTYVKTIRTYLVKGFNLKSTLEAMKWIRKWAFEEIEVSNKVGESLPEQLLLSIFAETPNRVNTDISTNIQNYFHILTLQHNEKTSPENYYTFVSLFLSNIVIPSVKFYEQQISSNAQDFEMIFKNIQGYTGTLSTHRAVSERFLDKLKINQDKTIIPSIRDKIIKDYHDLHLKVVTIPPGLHSIEVLKLLEIKKTSESLPRRLKKPSEAPFNAIIDVGAYFKDESNESVASSLLDKEYKKSAAFYFSTNPETKNKLALKTNSATEKILHNMSRDSLEAAVNDAASRATFYDDANTTGVDIFQDDNGFAYVFIGIDTTSERFYQAVMRMRKLLKNQVVLIVVPNPVEHEILKLFESKKMTVELIIRFLHHNMNLQIRKHNGMALINMIKTIYKDAIYEAMLTSDSADKRQFTFWLKGSEMTLVDMASPLEKQKFDEFVFSIIRALDKQLSKILPDSHQFFMKKANRLLKLVLADEFNNNYDSTILSSANNDSDQMVENESEAQNETDKLLDMETERASLEVTDGPEQNETVFTNWSTEFPVVEAIRENLAKKDQSGFVPIFRIHDSYHRVILHKEMKLPAFFNEKIYISETMIKLNTLFGRYRRYLFYVVFFSSQRTNVTERAVVISEREFINLLGHINLSPENMVFGYERKHIRIVAGTGNMIFMGNDRKGLNEEEKQLLSEIMIFSGNTGTLEKSEWLPYFRNWIDQDKDLHSVLYSTIVVSPSERIRLESRHIAQYLDLRRETRERVFDILDFNLLNIYNGNHRRLAVFYEECLHRGLETNHLHYIVEIVSMMMHFRTTGFAEIKAMFLPVLLKFLWKSRLDGSDEMRKLILSLGPFMTQDNSSFIRYLQSLMIAVTRGEQIGPAGEFLMLSIETSIFRENYVYCATVEKVRDVLIAFKETGLIDKDPSILIRTTSPNLLYYTKESKILYSVLHEIIDTIKDLSVHERLLLEIYRSHHKSAFWEHPIVNYLKSKIVTKPSIEFVKQLYMLFFDLYRVNEIGLQELLYILKDLSWFDPIEFFRAVVDENQIPENDIVDHLFKFIFFCSLDNETLISRFSSLLRTINWFDEVHFFIVCSGFVALANANPNSILLFKTCLLDQQGFQIQEQDKREFQEKLNEILMNSRTEEISENDIKDMLEIVNPLKERKENKGEGGFVTEINSMIAHHENHCCSNTITRQGLTQMYNFVKKGEKDDPEIMDFLLHTIDDQPEEFADFVRSLLDEVENGYQFGRISEMLMLASQAGVLAAERTASRLEISALENMFKALDASGLVKQDPSIVLRVLSIKLLNFSNKKVSISSIIPIITRVILRSVTDSVVLEKLLLQMYQDDQSLLAEGSNRIQNYLEDRVKKVSPSQDFITALYKTIFKLARRLNIGLDRMEFAGERIYEQPWFEEDKFFKIVSSEATNEMQDMNVVAEFKACVTKAKEKKPSRKGS